ncbi:tripartite tricarboxylate transporter substrate binding protein [Delftia tsuruhatensis]|uniref:Bug family tripartite tricarboxylate transporter substrate binding protein n=1 Tax=Delftia tsuruhatensis TaxID=180282 RepID=UPI0030D4B049
MAGITKRQALAKGMALGAIGVAAIASLCGAAQANTDTGAWPDRPIRLVVPFPPGGPTDGAARVYAEALARQLGQPVVIENKPGASGAVAAGQFRTAAPDGYTLMMMVTPTIMAPHFFKNVKFHPATDFAPVTKIYDLPNVIAVNAQSLPKVTDLKSLFQYAKAQPSTLDYTSSGAGSSGHLSMELMKSARLHTMQHVAYKGSAPAMNDTLGGVVPVIYADMVSALPHIRSGRLRALAVGTPQRVKALDGVQTMAEQGFGCYEASSWGGLVAPRDTPRAIIDKLSATSRQLLATDEVRDRFEKIGVTAAYLNPQDTEGLIRSDYTRWGEVVRTNGLGAE